jgi:hypothetical protein
MVARPTLLNLHKPKDEAPANVPTLPLAPPAGPAGQPGGGAPGGSAAPGGGSRLNGLNPFPYGALPHGGPGLRGTLVGCANSDAVGLSSAERAHCNERFGVEGARAPVLDGIDPAKRRAFDRTSSQQDEQRRGGNSMPTGTSPGAQGLGGLGPN